MKRNANTPGIIYVPWIIKERTEPDTEYDAFMTQYNKDHKMCPLCGSEHYSTTLVGYILDMNNKEAYKDENYIECTICDFKGIAHDLISEEQFKMKQLNL